MLLGDVMQKFDDEVATLETLLTFEDLSLLADVEAAAARRRLTVGEYTKCAVERFVAQASNEEWITLVGQLARARDPAEAFLNRALRNSLVNT